MGKVLNYSLHPFKTSLILTFHKYLHFKSIIYSILSLIFTEKWTNWEVRSIHGRFCCWWCFLGCCSTIVGSENRKLYRLKTSESFRFNYFATKKERQILKRTTIARMPSRITAIAPALTLTLTSGKHNRNVERTICEWEEL